MEAVSTTPSLDELYQAVLALRSSMLEAEAARRDMASVPPEHRGAARNLVHYLALRQHDLRALQPALAALGLSSLGRTEGHSLASLDAVLHALTALGASANGVAPATAPTGFGSSGAVLAAASQALLGPAPDQRTVRIMVTMPPEAATDAGLVESTLAAGMDVMRINCAHDDTVAWQAMLANLRQAEARTGRRATVAMDLGGPKLRTGPLEPGPAVARWRPQRDAYGRTTEPARIWLTPAEQPRPAPVAVAATVPLPADWLVEMNPGDRLAFLDARGRDRSMAVVGVSGDGALAETRRTAYVTPETVLAWHRGGATEAHASTPVGQLPPMAQPLLLHEGDALILTRSQQPGHPARRTADGTTHPARIPCTLGAAFDDARAGQRIFFDDGKIGGVIEAVMPDAMTVRITEAAPAGSKLRPEKGINLPDTELTISALTHKDIEDLSFIVDHADAVSLSFVRSPDDVRLLQAHLEMLGREDIGIILKIETLAGFEALPELLLAALRSPKVGVMIARGDLAVECGFERMAELQEEMLWLCEAAHVPAIWATQVLESLAQSGLPSRAEITDAAMGVRAECVMLNKGPYVVRAIAALDDILIRMSAHQSKRSALLRPLRSWTPLPG